MSRYNRFHADETCPHCHSDADLAFQADIGRLDWSDYRPNEAIPHAPVTKPVGPDPGVDWSRA